MNIGVFGTGVVGQTIAAKLDELGHTVTVGTRDVSKTLARSDVDPYGRPPFSVWLKDHLNVRVGAYAEAARDAEILINAVNGDGTLDALRQASGHLDGKVLIDISNPLDFSHGMPPTLSVSNSDSLGEMIQREFPALKVVKTLNTLNAALMVDPRSLADGEHHIFVSGNDLDAKTQVTRLLTEWFGWKHVLDLGDITTARGPEMYLPLWLRMWGALGTGVFNIRIVR